MKVTLELPDPKFNKGDVVRNGQLILHIWRVAAHGEWHYLAGGGGLEAYCDDSFRYSCTIQGGRGPENDLIRPGIIVTYPERGYSDHQLINAEKIVWDKPIILPDDMENLAERQDAWDRRKG
jgi:hypothetical protein